MTMAITMSMATAAHAAITIINDRADSIARLKDLCPKTP